MADCSLLCTRLLQKCHQPHAWRTSIKPNACARHGGISDKLIIPDSTFNEQVTNHEAEWHSWLQVLHQRENVLGSSEVPFCYNRVSSGGLAVVLHGEQCRTFIGLYLVHLWDNSCKIRRPLLPVSAPNKWNRVNYSSLCLWPPGNISNTQYYYTLAAWLLQKRQEIQINAAWASWIWINAQRAFRQNAGLLIWHSSTAALWAYFLPVQTCTGSRPTLYLGFKNPHVSSSLAVIIWATLQFTAKNYHCMSYNLPHLSMYEVNCSLQS